MPAIVAFVLRVIVISVAREGHGPDGARPKQVSNGDARSALVMPTAPPKSRSGGPRVSWRPSGAPRLGRLSTSSSLSHNLVP